MIESSTKWYSKSYQIDPNGITLKGAKGQLAVTSKFKGGGDSSQLHAKEFVGRRRKWGYQKEIKI